MFKKHLLRKSFILLLICTHVILTFIETLLLYNISKTCFFFQMALEALLNLFGLLNKHLQVNLNKVYEK